MLTTALPFKSFSEIRDKFWERLRRRGYSFKFFLLLFSDVCYNDTKKWFSRPFDHRSRPGRIMVFRTTLSCSYARMENIINNILPHMDCTVCYRKTVTLANLCR